MRIKTFEVMFRAREAIKMNEDLELRLASAGGTGGVGTVVQLRC